MKSYLMVISVLTVLAGACTRTRPVDLGSGLPISSDGGLDASIDGGPDGDGETDERIDEARRR